MFGRIRMRGLIALVVSGLVAALCVGLPSPASAAEPDLITADVLSTMQTNGTVWTIESVGGVVYVGGSFTSVRPSGSASGTGEITRNRFAAFNGATGALLDCAPSFSGPIYEMDASPDGTRLYVGGSFGSVSGTGVANFVALSIPACTLVPSASFTRPAVNAPVRAVSATADSVFIGGEFSTVSTLTRGRFAKLTSSGAVTDVSTSFNDVVRAIAAVPEHGRVLVGGKFTQVNTSTVQALVSLNPDTGAIGQTFPGWVPGGSAVQTIITDGTQFYTGNEGSGIGIFDGRIAGDLATGAMVWKDRCLGATQALAIRNEILYAGHHAHDCALTQGGYVEDGFRQHYTAQPTTGAEPQLLPWFPDTNEGALATDLGPQALAFSGDVLWSGGQFTTVNGVAQQGLVRFSPGPDKGTVTSPKPIATSMSAGKVMVTWRTTWDRDDDQLTYQLYRGTTLIDTQTVWSREWSRPYLSFVDTVPAGSTQTYRTRVVEPDGDVTSALSSTTSVTVATSDASYAGAVMADDPDIYWRLSDTAVQAKATRIGQPYNSALMTDVSGNNAPGTVEGGYTNTGPRTPEGFTLGVPGVVAGDGALRLDGVNGRLASSYGNDAAPVRTAPSEFSVELWFNTTTTSGGKLIGFGNRRSDFWTRMTTTNAIPTYLSMNSTTYDRHVYMDPSGTLNFGVQAPAEKVTIRSAQAYNDGQWHHLVATLGSSGMRLYVDQVQVAADPNSESTSYTGYWRVGEDNVDGWPRVATGTQRAFAGDIDEVAVYPTALAADRVHAHYASVVGGADTAAPTAPANVAYTTVDDFPQITWDASVDDVAVSGYDVYRSSDPGFAIEGLTPVLSTGSTQYHDTSTTPGDWYYRVVARDAAGNSSAASEELHVEVLPEPVVTQTVAPSADSFVHELSASTNYGTSTTLSTDSSPALVTYLKFAMPALPEGRVLSGATLRIRTTSAAAATSADAQNVSVAGNGWTESGLLYSNRPTVSSTVIGTLPGGSKVSTTYDVPLSAIALRSALGSELTLAIRSSGPDSFSLTSKESTTAANRPSLVLDFGLEANADRQPPSAPDELTAANVSGGVQLEWLASTDNVAVAGYQVYGSRDADFVPSQASSLGETSGTTFTVPTSALGDGGDWHFRVTADDAEDNVSESSDRVTVAVPTIPVTVVLSPTADTYVHQSNASTNFGSSTTLSVDGSPLVNSYLRFVLPSAPANKSLVSARLTVRTTALDSGGTVDRLDVVTTTDTWVEGSVTYPTRPTATSGALGSLVGMPALSTSYTIALDAAAVTPLLGASTSFGLVMTGGDAVQLSSRNSSTTTNRPVLELVFQ